jgi:hypothetical protein
MARSIWATFGSWAGHEFIQSIDLNPTVIAISNSRPIRNHILALRACYNGVPPIPLTMRGPRSWW